MKASVYSVQYYHALKTFLACCHPPFRVESYGMSKSQWLVSTTSLTLRSFSYHLKGGIG